MTSAGRPFPDPLIDQPPRPARRILVSVRLFVALLAALGFGSVLWVAITAYLQHRATTEILRLGGYYSSEQTAPRWLCNLVGDDRLRLFESVTAVYLRDAPVTDASLQGFRWLRGLRVLDLDHTQVTDADLVHLSGLTQLQYLDLHGTGITDRGLAHLAGLAELRDLSLSSTGVTDDGLAELRRFTKLHRLTLGPAVTDDGVPDLCALDQLQTLWLVRTEITPEGFKTLKAALPQCGISH